MITNSAISEVNLLLKACEGNSDAQYQLGISYCIRAVPKQAYYWLHKAAKQGNHRAVSVLEELDSKGLVDGRVV